MTAPVRSKWPSPWREPGRVKPGRYDGPVALMVSILRDRETLPGALCRGQAPAFDADQLDGEDQAAHADRLTAARSACQRCPELLRCPAPLTGRSPTRRG